MAKQNVKGSKSKVSAMTKDKKPLMQALRKKYQQNPTMRTDAPNIAALKKIRDCLEIRHAKDMIELDIKDLSIDDALTCVLVAFARSHREVAEILSLDSRMIKIMKYSGSV